MSHLMKLRRKFKSVWPLLNERTRRVLAASEAMSLGYGGVTLVSRACGLSRKAITKGLREIQGATGLAADRIRGPGGGRKRLTEANPGLLPALGNAH